MDGGHNISMTRSPLKTLYYFGCVVVEAFYSLLRHIVHHWFQSAAVFVIAYGTYIVSHADAAQLASLGLSVAIRDAAVDAGKFALYWITLGILSSIGLGSGLHTFVLFLGPHILRIASFAVLHNSLDFTAQIASYMKVPSAFDVSGLSEAFSPNYASDAWSLRDSRDAGVSLFGLALKVAWPSFLWGLGTSIGELPPYFIARAARAAGTALEELQELQKLEHEVDEEGSPGDESPYGGSAWGAQEGAGGKGSGLGAGRGLASGLSISSPRGRFARAANPLSSAARAQAKARIFRAMSASSMGEAIAAAAARARSPSAAAAGSASGAASPSTGYRGRTPGTPGTPAATDALHSISVAERAKLVVYEAVQAYGFWAVLAAASIPNPLFDLAGLTCGHFGIPFATFFTATLLGKAVIKVSLQVLFLLYSVLYGLKAFEWIREHSMSWLPYLPGVGMHVARALESAEASILASQHSMCSPATHAGWSAEQCRACCVSHFSAPGRGLSQCLDNTCSASSAAATGSASSGWVKTAWGYILLAMILYFVSSTISALAQEYAVRQAAASAAAASASDDFSSAVEQSAMTVLNTPGTPSTPVMPYTGSSGTSGAGKRGGGARKGSPGASAGGAGRVRSTTPQSAGKGGRAGSATKQPASAKAAHGGVRQRLTASGAGVSRALLQSSTAGNSADEVEVEDAAAGVDEEVYEVESVVDMALREGAPVPVSPGRAGGKGGKQPGLIGPGTAVTDLYFRTRWVGWPPSDDSWLTRADFNSKAPVKRFLASRGYKEVGGVLAQL